MGAGGSPLGIVVRRGVRVRSSTSARVRRAGAPSRTLPRLVPAAVVLVLLVTGCSTGDGPSGAGSPTADRPPQQTAPPPDGQAPPPVAAPSDLVRPTASCDAQPQDRRWVSVDGSPDASGTTPEEPAALSALDDLAAAMPGGGEVLLTAGTYRVEEPVELRHGGAPGSPLVVRGEPGVVLAGERADPWQDGKEHGDVVLELGAGADHVRLEALAVQDVETVVRVVEDVVDLCVQDVESDNVRRFLDTTVEDAETASVAGLTVRRASVRGYSKGGLRLRYDTSDVLVEDVVLDSERQDRDDFAMGVHLDGRVSRVVLRRVEARNSQDTRDEDDYWNGDGFASEREVSDVVFEQTVASGSTDGGYDLKSTRTTLVGTVAEDNKRNYRFWADDTVVTDCVAAAPVKRGGSGQTAQVQLNPGAQVSMTGCRMERTPAGAVVHELNDGALLELAGEERVDSGDADPDSTEGDAEITGR